MQIRILNQHGSNWRAVVAYLAWMLVALFFGSFLLFLGFIAVADGQLKIPRKLSSTPATIVSPKQGAAFYYGFLLFYVAIGSAVVASAFAATWRLWRSSPLERSIVLAGVISSRPHRPPRIFRSVLLFGLVPLAAIVVIMFALILQA